LKTWWAEIVYYEHNLAIPKLRGMYKASNAFLNTILLVFINHWSFFLFGVRRELTKCSTDFTVQERNLKVALWQQQDTSAATIISKKRNNQFLTEVLKVDQKKNWHCPKKARSVEICLQRCHVIIILDEIEPLLYLRKWRCQ